MNSTEKGGVHLSKIDNKYYINGDGNNRSCVAKFAGLHFNKVSITQCYLNKEKYDQYVFNQWFEERHIIFLGFEGEYIKVEINHEGEFLILNTFLESFQSYYDSIILKPKSSLLNKLGYNKPFPKLISSKEDLYSFELQDMIFRNRTKWLTFSDQAKKLRV